MAATVWPGKRGSYGEAPRQRGHSAVVNSVVSCVPGSLASSSCGGALDAVELEDESSGVAATVWPLRCRDADVQRSASPLAAA
eukprot:scaffold86944_cov82-Phaeocystis_antarctica.AAC.1